MKDMQQISVKQFVQINEVVENVSKQLSGWQKAMGYKKFPVSVLNVTANRSVPIKSGNPLHN